MSKKMRRIGFNASGDESEQQPQAAIKQFIEAKYAPSGFSENMEFKTSLEIEYELRESIEGVSLSAINEIMNELGFQLKFLEDKPHWVVYPTFQ